MTTAKIIRHRHSTHKFINEHLKSVEEVVYFKIVFSDPQEMTKFEEWCKDNGGNYQYDKENSCQYGEQPKPKELQGEDICWCDIFSWYLLHIAEFEYHSSIHPYKGEVYIKN